MGYFVNVYKVKVPVFVNIFEKEIGYNNLSKNIGGFFRYLPYIEIYNFEEIDNIFMPYGEGYGEGAFSFSLLVECIYGSFVDFNPIGNFVSFSFVAFYPTSRRAKFSYK
jgi:hypothetical protein